MRKWDKQMMKGLYKDAVTYLVVEPEVKREASVTAPGQGPLVVIKWLQEHVEARVPVRCPADCAGR